MFYLISLHEKWRYIRVHVSKKVSDALAIYHTSANSLTTIIDHNRVFSSYVQKVVKKPQAVLIRESHIHVYNGVILQ